MGLTLDAEAAKAYVDARKIPWPTYVTEPASNAIIQWFSTGNDAALELQCAVVDAQGKIVAIVKGDDIKGAVDKVLAK